MAKPGKHKRLRMANSSMSFEEEMKPVTYCGNVGWEGTVVLSWYLVVIGCFVYILREYTAGFSKFDRDKVWIFVALPIFVLRIISVERFNMEIVC